MPASYLTHTDPARNMARFYRLDVQPDLFGGWSVFREWGRIGAAGQTMARSFASEAEAIGAAEAVQSAKLRRGYSIARAL